jgi:hypothetical protein
MPVSPSAFLTDPDVVSKLFMNFRVGFGERRLFAKVEAGFFLREQASDTAKPCPETRRP